jgi:hypothetical protein
MSENEIRQDNGLTQKQELGLVGMAVRKRFKLSSHARRRAVQIAEEIMETAIDPEVRLRAIETMIKMEVVNQNDEKLQLVLQRGNGGASGVQQPTVVLLLPPNGTEKPLGNQG